MSVPRETFHLSGGRCRQFAQENLLFLSKIMPFIYESKDRIIAKKVVE